MQSSVLRFILTLFIILPLFPRKVYSISSCKQKFHKKFPLDLSAGAGKIFFAFWKKLLTKQKCCDIKYMNIYSYIHKKGESHMFQDNIMHSTEDEYYELADFYKLFSDSSRIKILFVLLSGAHCVKHIAEKTEMSQSAVSHQLAVLRRSNIIRQTRSGQNITYSLAEDPEKPLPETPRPHITARHGAAKRRKRHLIHLRCPRARTRSRTRTRAQARA